MAALPATALCPEVLSQSEQHIIHVDTKTGGPLLQGSVVKAEGILPEGAAPRARSYIEFTVRPSSLPSGWILRQPGSGTTCRRRLAGGHVGFLLRGLGEFAILYGVVD